MDRNSACGGDAEERPRIVFRRKYPWSLLPEKPRIDLDSARDRASLHRNEFRWLRAERQKELCWPWRIGFTSGWLVRSPIDVRMDPLEDIEVVSADDQLEDLSRQTGYSEVWQRGETSIALPGPSWLRLHQFRSVHGGWTAMFIPNGEGTLEWHLGWSVEIPPKKLLMVLPAGNATGLETLTGVFDAANLNRLADGPGMAIAVRPRHRTWIRRGETIARLLLLDPKCLNAAAQYGTPQDEGAEA